jgi:hypothetical protein
VISTSTIRKAYPRQPQSAIWLALATIAAALFAAAPAILDVVDYVRFSDAPGAAFVARWALMVLLLGSLQAAYGLYVILCPDWAAVWSVTVALLAHAGIYAMALGLILISSAGGTLLGQHGLQLTDRLAGGKAALWCICIVSLSTILAFLAGRLSFACRRADLLARRTPLFHLTEVHAAAAKEAL